MALTLRTMSASAVRLLGGVRKRPEPMSPLPSPKHRETVRRRVHDAPPVSNDALALLRPHAPPMSSICDDVGYSVDTDSRRRKRRRRSPQQRGSGEPEVGSAWASVFPPRPHPHSPLVLKSGVLHLWAVCPAAISAKDSEPRDSALAALGHRLASCFGRATSHSGEGALESVGTAAVHGPHLPEKLTKAPQRPSGSPVPTPEPDPPCARPTDAEGREASPPNTASHSGRSGRVPGAGAAAAAPVAADASTAPTAPVSAGNTMRNPAAEAQCRHGSLAGVPPPSESRNWGLLAPQDESIAFRRVLSDRQSPHPYPRWSSLSVVEHLALAWLESRVRLAARSSALAPLNHPLSRGMRARSC